MKAYPALVDEGDTVAVRLFDTEAEQRQAMWRGTRRLILLNIPVNPAKFASDKLTNQQKLALSRNPHGSIQALFDDCATAAADRLIADHGGPAWDEESFRKLYDKVRADLVDATVRTVGQVQQVLAAWQACERPPEGHDEPGAARQRSRTYATSWTRSIKPGFVTEHGAAPAARPDALPGRRRPPAPADARRTSSGTRRGWRRSTRCRTSTRGCWSSCRRAGRCRRRSLDIRWMIEELRVSYFAHALGTAYPVSDKRIVKAIDAAAP